MVSAIFHPGTAGQPVLALRIVAGFSPPEAFRCAVKAERSTSTPMDRAKSRDVPVWRGFLDRMNS